MLGAWKQQDVGFTYSGNSMCIHAGYLYRFGGASTNGAQLTTDSWIQSAKILEDGSLGQAEIVGNFAQARQSAGLVRLNNHVFLLGGKINGAISDLVTRFTLSTNGGISAPTTCEPLPFLSGVSNLTSRIVQIHNKVLIWRPFVSSAIATRNEVYSGTLTESGIQDLASFTQTPDASSLSSIGIAVYKDNLIVAGGRLSGALQSTVWSCKVNAIGRCSATAWRKVGELPVPLDSLSCIVVNNNLFVVGGQKTIAGSVATEKVQWAKLDHDGNLVTKFVETGALVTATATYRGTMVATGTHIYSGGGLATGVVPTNVVQYAPIVRGP